MKSTEINFGNKFVDALKEQYDFDVIKTREDYENNMKDFPVSVFDFANLEKVKRLQGYAKELLYNSGICKIQYRDNIQIIVSYLDHWICCKL